MKYRSTRGQSKNLSFEQVVFAGLAPDGGLYLPHSIPSLPENWDKDWKDLSFQDLALNIFSLFISPEELPTEDLVKIIQRSYDTFTHDPPTPLVINAVDHGLHVLELFHGPTLAFKDVALQCLGNLFEYFLKRKNARLVAEGKPEEKMTVVGATSGDTGSAAIYGLRGKRNVSVFILHPQGRVSPVQEAQMTTVCDTNVHNLALEGTFDDCQDIVKGLFANEPFRSRHLLGAVNSINWARILAQTVYYFHSYFSLLRNLPKCTSHPVPLRYVVPTGNFGDVLAGYYAKCLGLPISKLTIATNENDILKRFFDTGRYEKVKVKSGKAATPADTVCSKTGEEDATEAVKATTSPAMDILVSSNFERLLWHMAKNTAEDPQTMNPGVGSSAEDFASETITTWMRSVKEKGGVKVSDEVWHRCKEMFEAERTDDAQTLETIRDTYDRTGYLLDPHTAVGVHAAQMVNAQEKMQTICLSTAHPAKFPSAIHTALGSTEKIPEDVVTRLNPPVFDGLLSRKRRVIFVPGPKEGSGLPPSLQVVMDVIERNLQNEE